MTAFEGLLLREYVRWLCAPEAAPVTPEVAAGFFLVLWGGAEAALRMLRCRDPWHAQVREWLEVARGG